ncbi:MAG: AfsR/SARP family transcriptional regulator [Actinomycetota bacterium]
MGAGSRTATRRDRTATWGGAMDAPLGLSLLGGFELTVDGELVHLPLGSQRLIAYLAVRQRAVSRSNVAGTLWRDSSEQHSHASLRSALWRANKSRIRLVVADGQNMQLDSCLSVDVHDLVTTAHRLLRQPVGGAEPAPPFELLLHDLLPEWDDDWIVMERERLRQLRLHALEALAGRLTGAQRYGDAIEAGQAAVRAEPLRESSHRTLIRTHLAEGNYVEALRQFRLYATLLRFELGLEPSAEMRSLVDDVRVVRAPRTLRLGRVRDPGVGPSDLEVGGLVRVPLAKEPS